MSVRKFERDANEEDVFHLYHNAIELIAYTEEKCMNEKYFPKRRRWTIANRLIDNSVAIAQYIKMANGMPLNESHISKRQEYQYLAKASINAMYALLDAAVVSTCNISSESYDHWIGLITNILDKLNNWIKSDIARIQKR